jgi:hypothetical protein
MEFDFHANVLNSSKEALQQGIGQLMGTYLQPAFIQAGITTPRTIYNLGRDFARYQGQNPDGKYLERPHPEAGLPKISYEEAITYILAGRKPHGLPLEPAQEHLQKLQEFGSDPVRIRMLNENGIQMLQEYIQSVQARAQQEQQQAALAQASQQGQGAPGGPAPAEPPGDNSPTPVQGDELLDESLPGAGGGANQGVPGV